jgi:hypothetical protein
VKISAFIVKEELQKQVAIAIASSVLFGVTVADENTQKQRGEDA